MDFNTKENKKYYIAGGLIAILLIGVGFFSLSGLSPWSYWWEDDDDASAPKLTSTFTLIDYRTGEDVSSWVEISVWTEDPDDLPFDADNDPYTLTNFEEEVNSDEANTVSIDLRSYTHVYLEIDPDYESDYGGNDAAAGLLGDGFTVSDDFRHIFGGVNRDYMVYVYHLPSDIPITVRDRINNDEWGTTHDAPRFGNSTNDGHFVVELDMLWNSAHGLHAGDTGGDEWEVDDDEWDEMTPSEHYWMRDQKNFRTIAPLYSLNDDVGKNFDDELELYTNCFAVNFTLNDTVSEVVGNVNYINFTLAERDYKDIPAEVIFDVTSILVIFYEPIVCYDHYYSFEFDIEFGNEINCTGVYSGRIFTPYDDDNLGAWTEINQAELWNAPWNGWA